MEAHTGDRFEAGFGAFADGLAPYPSAPAEAKLFKVGADDALTQHRRREREEADAGWRKRQRSSQYASRDRANRVRVPRSPGNRKEAPDQIPVAGASEIQLGSGDRIDPLAARGWMGAGT
jgi:hypothetical protein